MYIKYETLFTFFDDIVRSIILSVKFLMLHGPCIFPIPLKLTWTGYGNDVIDHFRD